MLEPVAIEQDLDEDGPAAGGIVTGQNCNPEIDKDGDKVPDNLDAEGPIDWSHCTMEVVIYLIVIYLVLIYQVRIYMGQSLIIQIFLEQIFRTQYYTRQT